MKAVKTMHKYTFYRGIDSNGPFWNIIKSDKPAPIGGYRDKQYILKIKGFKPNDWK